MGWRDLVGGTTPAPPPATAPAGGAGKTKDDGLDLDFPAAPRPEDVGVVEDVLRSGAAGARRGVEGIPGAPGDIGQLAQIGAAWLAGKLGASPQTQQGIREADVIPFVDLPTTDDIHQETDKWIGTSYEPQTTAGKYAATGAEFGFGALGPGGPLKQLGKAAIGTAGGLVSEAAGQATEGTALEPWARAAGGIAGGAGVDTAAGTRQFVKTADDRAAEIAAADAAAQHGVKLTKGQRSGNIEQQRAEQEMLHGSKGSWAETLMQNREKENLKAIEEASTNVMDTAAPSRGGTPVESGGLLNQQTRDRAQQLKAEGAAGIEKAINQGVMIDADRLRGLPNELRTKLQGDTPYVPDVIIDVNTPIAKQAMDRVNTFIKAAEDPNVKEVSLAGAERLRQQLTKLAAKDPEDRRAMSQVMKHFDDWYDDALDNNARVMPDSSTLSGPGGTPDPRDVLTELKTSRGKYGEGAQIERPRAPHPPGAEAVSRMAGEGSIPERTAMLLTPKNDGTMSVQAIEAIERLVKVGAGSSDLDQVRDIVLNQLLKGDPGKVASRVQNFIKSSPTTANQLFSAEDLDKMKSLAGTNKRLVPDPKATNPSKSSYSLVREGAKTAARKVAGSIPIVGPLLEGGAELVGNVKNRKVALDALKDVNRDTLTKTIVKKGAEGGGRALPGSVQGAKTMTVDDPGGPNDGKKVRITGKTDSGKWRGVLPNGEEYVFGEKAVK
jgi:hypothetical protein